MNFTFIDLFAGIGGFALPLVKLGGKCLAYAEIDKEAIFTYKQNFPQHKENLGDISSLVNLPVADLVVGGVPCQPWSIAGKNEGFKDPRGQLWFDVILLIKQSQPKSFLLENVNGLTFKNHQKSFDLIVGSLRRAGYRLKWQILDSYDFGLPQNRKRLFLVGIREDIYLEEYLFPVPNSSHPMLADFFPGYFQGEPVETTFNNFFVFTDIRGGETAIHSWDLKNTFEVEKKACLALLKERRNLRKGKDGHRVPLEDLKSRIEDLRLRDLSRLISKGILTQSTDGRYDFCNSRLNLGIEGTYRIFLPSARSLPTVTTKGGLDFVATQYLAGTTPANCKVNFLEQIYLPRKFVPFGSSFALAMQGFPHSFQVHPKESVCLKQLGNAVSPPVIEAITTNLLKTICQQIT